MISRTIQASDVQAIVPQQQQTQASYLQYLSAKIEAIMEQVRSDKKQMEDYFLTEKRKLSQEIKDSHFKIEQLQKMISELQLQNQQMNYQYQQSTIRANIMRRQNLSMSQRFAREKRQMQQAAQRLALENEDLKQIIRQISCNNQSHYLSPRKAHRSPTIIINHICPSFCLSDRRCKRLHKPTSNEKFKSPKKQPAFQSCQMSSSVFESGIDPNLTLTDTLKLQKRQQSDFAVSTATKSKRQIYTRDTEEMSTKTQLSPRYYLSKDTKKRL